MTNQTVTVNIHDPRIEKVWRQEGGKLTIDLGNDVYHGSVGLFVSDDWAAELCETVFKFLEKEADA